MRRPTALLLSSLALTTSAAAQTAELSRATCGQLLALPQGDRGQLLLWLHGYYAGAAQRPVLDRAKVNESAEGMLKACAAKADLPLVGAEAREIFLGSTQPGGPPSSTGVTVTTGTPAGSAPAQPPTPAQSSMPSGQPAGAPPTGTAPASTVPRPVR